MANPSDAPASSAGTEIIRRTHANIIGTGTTTLLTGEANYTYTMLSIIISNQSGSDAEDLKFWVLADNSTEVMIMKEEVLSAKKTFVFSDRFALVGTDKLQMALPAGTGDLDIYITYIENRWS